MATKKTQTTIDVVKFDQGKINYHILGRSPLICNRMSEKAKHDLLFPKGRKTAADKARSLKHNPYQEFRDSPYTDPNENADTLICHLAAAFKASIRGAGVDVPGSTKAQLGRLMWVEYERIPIYGIPKLMMAVTRSADMARTPDVRTRAIIPNWACQITVSFMRPVLNETTITNLLVTAGLIQGIGDWRPEKGSGNYGQFQVVNKDDPEYQAVITGGGRAAQKQAMENPASYDQDTDDLLEWFDAEAGRRGLEVA